MKISNLGILTGVSYVSGLDYYKGINERFIKNTPKKYVMSPNPPIIMVSVDCDKYVHNLTIKSFDKVIEHLLKGVSKLVAAGAEILVIASNTSHICVPAVEKEFPKLKVLHIADCTALKLKKNGFKEVGLIGTKPTMKENYLRDRFLMHGIKTMVPEEKETREEIYDIICQELSFNIFKDKSRKRFVEIIRSFKDRGAKAFISGCTEIELLVKQEHIPDFPLFPSAEIHIQTAADVLLGKVKLKDILPPKK